MSDYDAILIGSGVNSLACGALLARAGWRVCVLERNDWFGRAGFAEFTAELLQTSRDWLQQGFASERAHGLLAPWVLHTGLGPDAATSGFMTQVIAVAVQEGGMPIPRGGGAKLADALVQLIRDHGGRCETGVDVEHVVVQMGRATAVRTAQGD